MGDRRTELLKLLDRSGASLFALLTRLTLRQDVAEELMQDLFLKLSAAKDQGDIDCWYAYARRTAINLAFDWRRRQKIRRTCSLDESLDRVSEAGSPLGTLIEAEELEQVLAAIDRLRGPSREAFVLRYIEQESYERIAEQLGKTPHHVRALCSRAMSMLRNCVVEDGKEVQHVEDE
ncbi:MAG: sigma-70 family RNA polymerase sigma factor [Phycisphaerae bacterium]|nr:sigma-70 family RNA polymerase sigma factor [Phycisphaerae bacterium]